MEVILKTSTEITESPRNLDASMFDIPQPLASVITLSELGTTKNYHKVITNVKVLSMMEPMCVAGGKMKQDMTIGDETDTTKVTLWEEYVDSLAVQCSYKLKNFVVREYASQKYLSMPKAGAEIIPIDDIGAVAEPAMTDAVLTEILNVEIIGAPQLDTYKTCLKCKARVEPLTPPLGKCSKLGCGMMQ